MTSGGWLLRDVLAHGDFRDQLATAKEDYREAQQLAGELRRLITHRDNT